MNTQSLKASFLTLCWSELDTLLQAAPSIDLDQLADLQGTLKLLRDAGLL
ncbi:hypothetical protein ACT691_12755 [Vibrio metschnikovii]